MSTVPYFISGYNFIFIFKYIQDTVQALTKLFLKRELLIPGTGTYNFYLFN